MGMYGPGSASDEEIQGTGVCSKCGFENEPGTFACLSCDHILDETDVTVCSKCGFENASDLVECLDCGHALGDADVSGADRVDAVEVFSTRNPAVANTVWEQLRAAGMTCEILDSGGTVTVADVALAAGRGETSTRPLFILAPADQASRAETLIEQMDLDEDAPRIEDAPGESDGHFCPECETPYRPEDYDPQALRIYCSTCRAELPRQGTSRFAARGRSDTSNPG